MIGDGALGARQLPHVCEPSSPGAGAALFGRSLEVCRLVVVEVECVVDGGGVVQGRRGGQRRRALGRLNERSP